MFAKIIIIYKTREILLTNCVKNLMNGRFSEMKVSQKLENRSIFLTFGLLNDRICRSSRT